ncbi:uncharacterized protein LOC108910845 [Anoplophora glabripennis]|uniref:uncharacterized protein LOC108910845 n=1 Tax=Anoplophora glabripennis TaxID=217634 RepID=UPI000874AFE0|nr:uncharacterized protein LOC108910845 [Anoplophora glabripennis]
MERYFKTIPKPKRKIDCTVTSVTSNMATNENSDNNVREKENFNNSLNLVTSNLVDLDQLAYETTSESGGCCEDEMYSDCEAEVVIFKEIPTKKKKANPTNRYCRKEWTTEFPWLVISDKRDAIFCKYCHVPLTKNRAHLRRHEERTSHQERLRQAKAIVDISNYLTENSKKELLSLKVKRAEYKLAMSVVEHNLPFLYMDHLPDLLKSIAPDSEILKLLNCARTKTTSMVKVMAVESQANLAHILTKTKFSIIVDETTDISVTKCLAILVRYVSTESNEVKDRLLSLIEVNDLSAAGIVTAILQVIDDLKIPRNNIIGFAADNAAVMMGNFNGVQAKLKELLPNIFVIGCICHSLALCASSAANKLPKEIEDFVRNLYNYLNGSAKRLKDFKQFQDFVNIKPHKLLRLSQTRWLSLEAVVLRILEQWPALRLYFQSAVLEDNLVAAEQILYGLENCIFKLYLTFLSYILPMINKINKEFQSEKSKLHVIYDRISSLYRTILKNYMQKSYVDQDGVKEDKIHLLDLNPMNVRMYLSNEDLYLGEDCALLLVDFSPNTELYQFKNHCLSYYIELCCQIRNRFQNLKQYEFFGLINPKKLCENTVSITPLLRQFIHLSDNNVMAIGSEARLISSLPENLKIKLVDLHFQDFWFELYSMKNSDDEKVFHNLCYFVFNIISLPHSSAAAERIFSTLNLVKTKTRNRLLPETCNAILLSKELINSTNTDCRNWDPDKTLLGKKLLL